MHHLTPYYANITSKRNLLEYAESDLGFYTLRASQPLTPSQIPKNVYGWVGYPPQASSTGLGDVRQKLISAVTAGSQEPPAL